MLQSKRYGLIGRETEKEKEVSSGRIYTQIGERIRVRKITPVNQHSNKIQSTSTLHMSMCKLVAGTGVTVQIQEMVITLMKLLYHPWHLGPNFFVYLWMFLPLVLQFVLDAPKARMMRSLVSESPRNSVHSAVLKNAVRSHQHSCVIYR